MRQHPVPGGVTAQAICEVERHRARCTWIRGDRGARRCERMRFEHHLRMAERHRACLLAKTRSLLEALAWRSCQTKAVGRSCAHAWSPVRAACSRPRGKSQAYPSIEGQAKMLNKMSATAEGWKFENTFLQISGIFSTISVA